MIQSQPSRRVERQASRKRPPQNVRLGVFLSAEDADQLDREADDRQDYGEIRFAAIGIVEDVELYVVYTMRGDVTRIISARRARKDERQEYHHTFGE